ncbi:MAG: ABC transporter substrate-binding protein [Chthoniobacterales bacterium]
MGGAIRAVGIIAGAIVSLLAGCGERPDESGETTLSVLMEPDGRGAWRELFDRFERANPGIRVNLVEGPAATDAREDLYVNSLLAGSHDYDLVYADVIWVPKFAAAGWLEDLTDRWDEWDDFVPASIAGATVDGRIYRVPTQLNGGLLYYRKDLLEAAGRGVPKTFAELREVSKQLRGDGRWGYVWQGKQYEGLVCNYLEILKGYGGTWIDAETGRIGLAESAAVEALTFLSDAVGTISPPGVTTYAEEDSRMVFQGGGAVFLRNWPYVYKSLAADESPLLKRVGIAPMPANPAGESAATLGGAGFCIVRGTSSRDAAWKLIEFVSSPESVGFMNDRIGLQPARRSFYEESKDPMQAELYDVLRRTTPRPSIPQYAQASDILQRHLSAAITGQAEPAEALRAAARETALLTGGEVAE